MPRRTNLSPCAFFCEFGEARASPRRRRKNHEREPPSDNQPERVKHCVSRSIAISVFRSNGKIRLRNDQTKKSVDVVSPKGLWYLKGMVRLLLSAVILLAFATGCGLTQNPPPTGKISIEAVSGNLAKKLAEPNAGLRGHRVSILNPTDQSVIASGTTDDAGMVEFDLPEGTYILVGASDQPQTVQLEAGQIAKFKLVTH